jgi:hypothetical protein
MAKPKVELTPEQKATESRKKLAEKFAKRANKHSIQCTICGGAVTQNQILAGDAVIVIGNFIKETAVCKQCRSGS